MSVGSDLLREFWRIGVRVELAGDRFRLTPPGIASDDLRNVLRSYRSEVCVVLDQLPAAGRCPICGASTGWGEIDGSITANCVSCALIVAERLGLGRKHISPEPSPIEPDLTWEEQTG